MREIASRGVTSVKDIFLKKKSMLFSRVWGVLCVVCLLFSGAREAKALSDPPSSVLMLWGSTADIDGPLSVALNPAGLSFQNGLGFTLIHTGMRLPWTDTSFTGTTASHGDGIGLFTGNRILPGWLAPLGLSIGSGFGVQFIYQEPGASTQPLLGQHLRISAGVSIRRNNWFSLGTVVHTTLGVDRDIQGFFAQDLGLMLRPSNWLALGFTVKNLFSTDYDNRVVPRILQVGFALRPLLHDRFVISSDVFISSGSAPEFRHRLEFEPVGGLVLGASFTHSILFNDFSIGTFLALRFGNTQVEGVGSLRSSGGNTSFHNLTTAISFSTETKRSLFRTGNLMPLVDIGGAMPERDRSISPRAGQPVFLNAIMKLDQIARDSKVNAILLRIGGLGCGLAKVQELRAALLRIKKSGKKIFVYMISGSMKGYYLASVADKIFLHPAGTVWLRGLASSRLFYADALKKIGVKAQFVKIGKYKNYPNQFTNNGWTPAHKEATKVLLDDLYGQLVNALAVARKKKPAEVKKWFEEGLYPSKSAKKSGLVDDVFYWGEIEKRIVQHAKKRFRLDVGYMRRKRKPVRWRGYQQIAVIHVDGSIVSGRSLDDPFFGVHLAGAGTIVRMLEKARFDSRVRAVVLRINSPGGEVLASDVIWRYVDLLNRRKPVVVSMGDVAASGGYYIAAPAREIIASKATVTGSIGIFAGKFDFSGLLAKLGVHHKVIKRGETADLFSPYKPYSKKQHKRLRFYIESSYKTFLQKVSKGQSLKLEKVKKVALGRVWSGTRAKKHGLVTRIGGLWLAIRRAKILAGMDANQKVDLLSLPRRVSWHLSIQLPSISTKSAAVPANYLAAILGRWKSMISRFQRLSLWAIEPLTIDAK